MSFRVVAGMGFAASAIFLWWFLAGASLIALVDLVATTQHAQADSPMRFYFDDGKDSVLPTDPKLTFGSREWSISGSWYVVQRPTGRLTLETPQGSFAFGPFTKCQTMGRGRRLYEITPEAGDSVSYTQRRSRVWWPRPFNIAWLGGTVSSRSRYMYHRLMWRTRNGAVLDMVWRDEQRFTTGQGWSDSYLPWPPHASVRPAQ